jgi:hypothetical protein
MNPDYRGFRERLRDAGFQSYKEYLQSELWRQKKAEFFEVRPRKCWVCNSQDQFELHHKTYERVTSERLDDLVGLCGKCHDKVHTVCKEKPWIALEDAHKEVAYQFDNRPEALRRREKNKGKPKKKLKGLKKLKRDAWRSKQELMNMNRQRAIANSQAKLTCTIR